MPKTYKIGTRGSLLALTQCGQVKKKLEELSGDKFELEIIKTQGDLITDVPLWQLDGKDFFTKELDQALLSGSVDMVVHSYKDLGSLRPEGIMLAAITQRNYSHDILLIRNEIKEKLQNETLGRESITIGTSSPRRIVNLKKHLNLFLPYGKKISVNTKVLRGNVNTRIQKLKDGNYDGILLALAGIERLALTASSADQLYPLLDGLDYMILPTGAFPTAAAQGALAIECNENRADKNELLEKLKQLHCHVSASEIKLEREAFNKYGGGCHLAVGISVKKYADHYLHVHKGIHDDKDIDKTFMTGVKPKQIKTIKTGTQDIFIGLKKTRVAELTSNKLINTICDQLIQQTPVPADIDKIFQTQSQHRIYYTGRYASSEFSKITPENIKKQSLWVAGVRSWQELAAKGYWCHGSSDGRGDNELDNLFKSKALYYMSKWNASKKTYVLSHNEATSTLGEVVSCYQRNYLPISSLKQQELTAISNCQIFYWTSFGQYRHYIKNFPAIKQSMHCCGLGKTWQQFNAAKIEVQPFNDVQSFTEFIENR